MLAPPQLLAQARAGVAGGIEDLRGRGERCKQAPPCMDGKMDTALTFRTFKEQPGCSSLPSSLPSCRFSPSVSFAATLRATCSKHSLLGTPGAGSVAQTEQVSYSAFLPAGSEFRVMITCKYIPDFPLCQLHSASDSLQHLSQTFRNSSCLLCIAYLFRQ